jgi:integrase/recombinase XerD
MGRRNYAILLLLSRLGLRAAEIVGLNLEDIDWDNALIKVWGEGRQRAQLPLPADVGQAVSKRMIRIVARQDIGPSFLQTGG